MIGGEWKRAGGDRQDAPLVRFRAVSCSRLRKAEAPIAHCYLPAPL